jgi:anti-sigma B factor antagonist
MINIYKSTQNDIITIKLEGRLDTVSSPEVQAVVDEFIDSAKAFVFDFNNLKYLSSAGLRILLTTQQIMEETGRPNVTVLGANEEVLEIFAVTGFDCVLNIK